MEKREYELTTARHNLRVRLYAKSDIDAKAIAERMLKSLISKGVLEEEALLKDLSNLREIGTIVG